MRPIDRLGTGRDVVKLLSHLHRLIIKVILIFLTTSSSISTFDSAFATLLDVNEAFVSALNHEKRKQNLPPIINGTIHAADFQVVFGVVNLQLLVAATASERITRRLFAFALSMPEADLWLPEPSCVIDQVGTLQDFHDILISVRGYP